MAGVWLRGGAGELLAGCCYVPVCCLLRLWPWQRMLCVHVHAWLAAVQCSCCGRGESGEVLR